MRKYRLIAKKGEGTFSEVIKAQNIKTGTFHAIKCMKSSYKTADQVRERCMDRWFALSPQHMQLSTRNLWQPIACASAHLPYTARWTAFGKYRPSNVLLHIQILSNSRKCCSILPADGLLLCLSCLREIYMSWWKVCACKHFWFVDYSLVSSISLLIIISFGDRSSPTLWWSNCEVVHATDFHFFGPHAWKGCFSSRYQGMPTRHCFYLCLSRFSSYANNLVVNAIISQRTYSSTSMESIWS